MSFEFRGDRKQTIMIIMMAFWVFLVRKREPPPGAADHLLDAANPPCVQIFDILLVQTPGRRNWN